MDEIDVDNPIADRKNSLVFISCLFTILAVVAFYGNLIKRSSLGLKGSEVEKK
jgi:hypothetical protein